MGLYVAIWVVCALVSLAVAGAKGRPQILWAALGFIFGPLAVLILLVLPKSEEKATAMAIQSGELTLCPYCREAVKAEAIKCKHCQSDLLVDAPAVSDDRIAHERLQQAISDGDIETVKTLLTLDFDVSSNPLPFGHLEYAELHGSDEMIELISARS